MDPYKHHIVTSLLSDYYDNLDAARHHWELGLGEMPEEDWEQLVPGPPSSAPKPSPALISGTRRAFLPRCSRTLAKGTRKLGTFRLHRSGTFTCS